MDLPELLAPGCALFLDFDGTLVDIAPVPEAVTVPRGLLDTLTALQRQLGGAVAVVSGRPIEQIDAYLAPLSLPVAGVHGTERRDAGGRTHLQATHALDAVRTAAQALLREFPGLRIEHKRGSLALHYRQRPDLAAVCEARMRAAVEASPGLVLMPGKMVLEAKPGGASKGLAIEAFMAEPPFAGRRPVFIGDDVTDELGFASVQRQGGIGIKVGEGASVAWQRLASPQAMREQLAQAARALAAAAQRQAGAELVR